MAIEKVEAYFKSFGLQERIIKLEESSAAVEKAAQAIGCQPKQIAKTMSFLVFDKPLLVVMAGDAKVDNKKYKNTFHQKAKMIPVGQVEDYIGYAPGGVCPFAIHNDIPVYLDISLKRFDRIYPAAGNGHSAIDLSLEELVEYSHMIEWVDICKDWLENK